MSGRNQHQDRGDAARRPARSQCQQRGSSDSRRRLRGLLPSASAQVTAQPARALAAEPQSRRRRAADGRRYTPVMPLVLYAVWLLVVALLHLDVTGRVRAGHRTTLLLKVLGLAALAIPAFVPLAAVYGRWWEWSGSTFPTIAHAYTVLS